MSYDLRVGVKVEGAEDCYAVIAEPEFHSPTYNLGTMFRKCTGWDFVQGEWYRVSDVLPLIERGIHELEFNPDEYHKYDAPNGWGTVSGAIQALRSLYTCIMNETGEGGWSWNEIPIGCLWVSW